MGSINVLLAVLGVRFTLLTAVAGSIWLTFVAGSDQLKLIAVAVYCSTVVIPLVWLASRR